MCTLPLSQSGIKSQWVQDFLLVQAGPGAHPASKTMVTRSFPPVKRSGRGVGHPPPSNVEVKERVELYLYSSSGPSWSVLGRTIPLFLVHCTELSKQSSLRFRIRATCPLHMNHAYTTSIFRSIADYKVFFSLEISKLSLTFKLKSDLQSMCITHIRHLKYSYTEVSISQEIHFPPQHAWWGGKHVKSFRNAVGQEFILAVSSILPRQCLLAVCYNPSFMHRGETGYVSKGHLANRWPSGTASSKKAEFSDLVDNGGNFWCFNKTVGLYSNNEEIYT